MKKIEYSFDDEYVSKFCYDFDNKKIEIYLTGYSDLLKNERIDKPCIWIIENWTDAKSKLSSGIFYNDLEQNLGIVSMILSAEIKQTKLEVTVNTLDNRYVDLLFDNPQIKLI